jgi:hypothetical protein
MSRQTNQQIMSGVVDALKIKRIANNTVRYERSNGDIVWRLHNTDVVTKHPDDTYTLNSGGWKTVTTKDRINTYFPGSVWSDKGLWYVGRGVNRSVFYDGMRVDVHGQDQAPKPVEVGEGQEQNAKELKRKISKFVRLIDDCEQLPIPHGGDCWLCMAFGEKPREHKRNLEFNHVANQSGPIENVDHLLSHLDEGYLHGTLLVNAMRWAGYSDQGIGLYYQMKDRDAFKRAVRRYLKRKLGLV